MSSKRKSQLALLTIPLAILTVGLVLNPLAFGGHHAPKKKHYPTFRQAGEHLQASLEQKMQQGGYSFRVVACAHNKGYSYVCAAKASSKGVTACAIVTFVDKGTGDVSVKKVQEGRESSCS
jgi:hypothetical protein